MEGVTVQAEVHPARLPDARYTTATMLLVLEVPLPAVMQIVGWSDAAVAKRYMHVPNEFMAAIAAQVGGQMWAGSSGEDGTADNGPAGK